MRTFIQTFALIFILCSTAPRLHASHGMGAELNYVCLGNDSFLVRLSFYRDCAGIQPGNTASISVISALCAQNLNYSLPLATGAPNPSEVEALCAAQAGSSTCNGGSLPGVELWLYESVIHLPAQCVDWLISFDLCCRNDAVTNLLTPGSYDLYAEARLDNSGGACNNSPVFNQKTFFVCVNQPANLNISAYDPDGDSLEFMSINPLSAGTPIPYVTGFSPSQPLTTSGPFVFNSQTGQMTFTPSAQEVAVIAVQVNEFRNGSLIGSTMYDIQVVVYNCSNSFPVISYMQNVTGANVVDSTTVSVCPGQSFSFTFAATDTNAADILTVSSPNVTATFPGSTLVFSGSGNNISGTFSWQPAGNDVGTHYLIVQAEDNACPIIGRTNSLFTINVIEGTSAGPDLYYCPAGGPVQLSASGGTAFAWTPATGLSDVNVSKPLASPTVTTDYVVTSNLIGGCGNTDTARVNVIADFALQLSGDDTICLNGSAQLQATASGPGAPFTYAWSPSGSLINPTSPNPIAAATSTTTYTLTVTASSGCVRRDSVMVAVNGVAPNVQVTADRNNVCPGDSVQLSSQFMLSCGPTVTGCSGLNPPVTKVVGANATTNFATPFAGSSEDSRYQALYLAADLRAAGITSGTITRLDFEVGTKASTNAYQNLTVKMGCTPVNTLSTAQGFITGGVDVYSSSVYLTSSGLNGFTLTTPYDWDGSSNLFIEICYDNPTGSSAGGNDQLLCSSTSYAASIRNYSNGVTGCSLSASFTYNYAPKITFHICPPLTSPYNFTWSPATGLSNPNIANPKASFQQATLYSLSVLDTSTACEGTGFIHLQTDTSYDIVTLVDGAICGGGSARIAVTVTGNAPQSVLACGANGTTCSTPSQTLQVGSGTQTGTAGTPYMGFWHDGRIQLLYRASDLQAAGISSSSTLTGIAFNVTTKSSTVPYNGFTIKMGCTSLTTLSTSFATSALTTVYGPIAYSTTTGWNTHTLASSFDWDGNSNLLVEICFDNTQYTAYDAIEYTPLTGNVNLYDNADFDTGCTLNFPTASSNRPNTRFTFCPAPQGTTTVQWTPAGTLSDPTIENPIASPTVTTTYYVDYTFLNNCTRHDSVTVVVNSFAFNAVVSNDTTICSANDNVQLFASGGNQYRWSNLPGLSCYSCPNPVASPDTTSDFVATVSDTNSGCVDNKTVRVAVAQQPVITISNDTIYCNHTPVILRANGDGFTAYQWSNAQTTAMIQTSVPGEYSVTTTTNQLCPASDTAQIYEDTDCVWPGDADKDSLANNFDVLYLGVGYGERGPFRPNANITWVGQSAPAWSQSFANGANFKHGDCNGDGVIDYQDTLAVVLNYDLNHPSTNSGTQSDPPLYLLVTEDTAREGDILYLPVFLGSDAAIVNRFYGIAFSINHDNSLVDANSFRFDPYNSFAGILNNNLMAFKMNLSSDSRLDVTLTRTNQTNSNGKGQIGTIAVKIKDNIIWNGVNVKELNLTFSSIKAIDGQENEVLIYPEPAKIYVVREPVGIRSAATQPKITVYPNPANNSVFIKTDKAMNAIVLTDVLGRELFVAEKIMGNEYSLDVSGFKNGNYLMKVRFENTEVIRKVVVLK